MVQPPLSLAIPNRKLRQHLPAVRRVHDLGMELDEVERAASRGGRRRTRSCEVCATFSQSGAERLHLVAVAHPGAEALRHAVEQRRAAVQDEGGGAVLRARPPWPPRRPWSCVVTWKP